MTFSSFFLPSLRLFSMLSQPVTLRDGESSCQEPQGGAEGTVQMEEMERKRWKGKGSAAGETPSGRAREGRGYGREKILGERRQEEILLYGSIINTTEMQ